MRFYLSFILLLLSVTLYSGIKPNPIYASEGLNYITICPLLNMSGAFWRHGGVIDNVAYPLFLSNPYKTDFEYIRLTTNSDAPSTFDFKLAPEEKTFVEVLQYQNTKLVGYYFVTARDNENKHGSVNYFYDDNGSLVRQTQNEHGNIKRHLFYEYDNKKLIKVREMNETASNSKDWGGYATVSFSNGKMILREYNSWDGKLAPYVYQISNDRITYLKTPMARCEDIQHTSHFYYEYNQNGFLTKVTEKEGNRVLSLTVLTYNEHNDLVKVVINDNICKSSEVLTIDYTYMDLSDNPLVNKEDHLWVERRIKEVSNFNKKKTTRYIIQRCEYFKGSDKPIVGKK